MYKRLFNDTFQSTLVTTLCYKSEVKYISKGVRLKKLKMNQVLAASDGRSLTFNVIRLLLTLIYVMSSYPSVHCTCVSFSFRKFSFRIPYRSCLKQRDRNSTALFKQEELTKYGCLSRSRNILNSLPRPCTDLEETP